MPELYPVILGSGAVMPSAGCAPEDMEADLKQQAKALSSLFSAGALRRIPLYARAGMLAAVRAADSAGIDPKQVPDAGLVIGSAYSCKKTSLDFMDSILDDGPQHASPLSFSHAVNNMAAGLISLNLGIKGPSCTVNTGELSLAGAMETAAMQLCTGKTDLVFVSMMDEEDSRFSQLFPEKRQTPLAAFFVLALREHGKAVTVDWSPAACGVELALSAALRLHEAVQSGTDATVTCGEPWAGAFASVAVKTV